MFSGWGRAPRWCTQEDGKHHQGDFTIEMTLRLPLQRCGTASAKEDLTFAFSSSFGVKVFFGRAARSAIFLQH